MNSIWAVLFVMTATLVGKWLLFDDDSPASEQDDLRNLKIADTPQKPEPPRLSKSA